MKLYKSKSLILVLWLLTLTFLSMAQSPTNKTQVDLTLDSNYYANTAYVVYVNSAVKMWTATSKNVVDTLLLKNGKFSFTFDCQTYEDGLFRVQVYSKESSEKTSPTSLGNFGLRASCVFIAPECVDKISVSIPHETQMYTVQSKREDSPNTRLMAWKDSTLRYRYMEDAMAQELRSLPDSSRQSAQLSYLTEFKAHHLAFQKGLLSETVWQGRGYEKFALYYFLKDVYSEEHLRQLLVSLAPDSLFFEAEIERANELLRSLAPQELSKAQEAFLYEVVPGYGTKMDTVSLVFWASWCAPCRLENQTILQEMHEQGHHIISISLDANLEAYNNAVMKDRITWDSRCYRDGMRSELAQEFGIRELPTSVVVYPSYSYRKTNFLLERK